MFTQRRWCMCVVIMLASSPVWANDKLDQDFKLWRTGFIRQVVQETDQLSNEKFSKPFTTEYYYLRARGLPSRQINFVGMNDFRSWLKYFAQKDFEPYLGALLLEFNSQQQERIKRQCLTCRAPKIYLQRLWPTVAMIDVHNGELTLDPTIRFLTYSLLREALVHEFTHLLVQSQSGNSYLAFKEGMTQHLTLCVGQRCRWPMLLGAYPDQVKVTQFLLRHSHERLSDWFINSAVTDEALLNSWVQYLAAQKSEAGERMLQAVLNNLEPAPRSELFMAIFTERTTEALQKRHKPPPPKIFTEVVITR